MRFIGLVVLIFSLYTITSAQATIDAGVGLHFNNPVGQNDIFGYLAGEYALPARITVGASVYGDFSRQNPRTTARATYGASFKFAELSGWNLSLGAGGFKVGNEVGGYGGVGAEYKGLEMWGAYGSQNFTDAEVFYPVYTRDKFSFGPFFAFHNMDAIQPIQRGGVKIRFKQ